MRFHLFGKKTKRAKPLGKICAVIPAAGSSQRMGGENKLMMELGEIPVLMHTLLAFERSTCIDEIIISCREGDIVPYSELCKSFALEKVTKIVVGGQTRTESVLAGVKECGPEIAYIAVHDGARPLVTEQVISLAVDKAIETGAAAPGVPIKDSVKRVRKGRIVENVDRDSLVAIQTPQVFDKALLFAALTHAAEEHQTYTDDCAAVEALGMAVSVTQGSYENIKITTPEDILIGEAILTSREA